MADYPVLDGDMVQFMPAFAAAVVAVRPGFMRGTGKVTAGTKLCLEGDETSLEVPGCMYVMPPFVIPGTGTLKIDQLLPNQLSVKSKDSAKKIILKGGSFIAKFQVQSPAKDPATQLTDPAPFYPGQGQFITTNFKVTIA